MEYREKSRVSDTQDETRNRGASLTTRYGESATTGTKTATQGTITLVMLCSQALFLKYNESYTYPFKRKGCQ